MAVTWRALRRRVLTPGVQETWLSTRGFHEKSPQSRELLEGIGETFLTGYAYAAEARTAAEAEQRLEALPRAVRGFAYEGAGMGFAMRDGLRPGRSSLLGGFLAGRAIDHEYMVYVGAGWALGRLPRFRWAKATAALTDPVLRWLVLDGYGFHQAYFHTARYVGQQYQDPDFPWPPEGPAGYCGRATDQGIGRALWFVCGSDARRVCAAVDAFPEARRPDLYAGAGLAASYAGGADEAELSAFRAGSRGYSAQVAQACAFAVTARVRAGLVVDHTVLAARILCGTTPERAAQICLEALPGPDAGGEVPAFEIWRRRISTGISALEGSSA